MMLSPISRVFTRLPFLMVLASCGGRDSPPPASNAAESRASDAPAGTPSDTTPSPAGATGTTHDVRMLGDAQGYRFDPADITINTGDAVRWHNVSGGPHDVAFWTDSIPVGTPARLGAQMPNTISPLTGPLLVEPSATYTISFAGLRPGVYRYYCTPHLALGMRGTITIKP